jgi:uncharacterized protein (TIGR02118 family)
MRAGKMRSDVMVKMVITFKRRAGMSLDAFKAYRRDVHAPLLFAIPEAAKIRRFVVSFPVPAPNWPAPNYDALVEAWFENVEDMEALFFSDNFQTKVDPDHAAFIDLSSVQRMISEETVVVG